MVIEHCGKKLKLPPAPAKGRCPVCKHVFTPAELVKAARQEVPKVAEPSLMDVLKELGMSMGEEPDDDPSVMGVDLDGDDDEEIMRKILGKQK